MNCGKGNNYNFSKELGMRNFFKKTLFSVIAILIFFVIVNEMMRWAWHRWVQVTLTKFDKELVHSLKPNVSGQMEISYGFGVWRNKKAYWGVSINSQGIRAYQDIPLKAENNFRIICLGDSITFGLDVDDFYTYPAQLEQILKKQIGKTATVEVINAGVIAYSSRNCLVYLDKRLIKYQPDLVILEAGFNDALPMISGIGGFHNQILKGNVETGWENIYSSPLNLARVVIYQQPIFRVILYGAFRILVHIWAKSGKNLDWKTIEEKDSSLDDNKFKNAQVPPEDFENNLRQFIWLSKKYNFRLLFYIPYRTPILYRKILVDIAQENHIPVVDFSKSLGQYGMNELLANPVYSQFLEYYRLRLGDDFLRKNPSFLITTDGLHPNAVSNRIIAEKISEMIISEKLYLSSER